ncbi:MAG: single-stranded DNA-binding protein [Spirochaetota bacterium]
MASNINLIVVEGRLTRDPELLKTKSGKSLCKFSVANNRYYFQGKNLVDEVSFFNVTTWGPLAERCGASLKKGNPVLVSGNLKQDNYQTKNGEKREAVGIIAANVKFIGARAKGDAPATGKVVKEASLSGQMAHAF